MTSDEAQSDEDPSGDEDEELDGDDLVDLILRGAPRPVDWARLDEAGTERALATLDQWVRWLVRRYALDHRDVPPCWTAHGALLEELSALHTAHRACFDRAGSAMGPVEWLRELGSTRARLQIWAARTGCRAGEHRPDTPALWVEDG